MITYEHKSWGSNDQFDEWPIASRGNPPENHHASNTNATILRNSNCAVSTLCLDIQFQLATVNTTFTKYWSQIMHYICFKGFFLNYSHAIFLIHLRCPYLNENNYNFEFYLILYTSHGLFLGLFLLQHEICFGCYLICGVRLFGYRCSMPNYEHFVSAVSAGKGDDMHLFSF